MMTFPIDGGGKKATQAVLSVLLAGWTLFRLGPLWEISRTFNRFDWGALLVLVLPSLLVPLVRKVLRRHPVCLRRAEVALESHTQAIQSIHDSRIGLWIALASAAGLYAELMLIRLHASFFRPADVCLAAPHSPPGAGFARRRLAAVLLPRNRLHARRDQEHYGACVVVWQHLDGDRRGHHFRSRSRLPGEPRRHDPGSAPARRGLRAPDGLPSPGPVALIPESGIGNLLGSMLGGFLEYNSMYFGFRSLYFLALVVYLLAFLTSVRWGRNRRTAPAAS